MKKKVILLVVGVVCFGFLFSYSLVDNNTTLEAENVKAFADVIKHDSYDPDSAACAHVTSGWCRYTDMIMRGKKY